MSTRLAAAMIVLAGTPVFAHRLDEYLQGTLISVEKNRMEAQMTLTPGVAVLPFVIASIDTDANGMISLAEQGQYAARVLRDLSLTIDGQRLTPRLESMRFPSMDDMKEGRGEIQFDFRADLPRGGRYRKITLENRHESRIAAYQVNCLIPRDPGIRIASQKRNYAQSRYELEFVQPDLPETSFSVSWPGTQAIVLGVAGLLLFTRLTFLCWRRPHV